MVNMNNNEDVLNSINNKLSVVINLLMRKEEMSVKDKVALMENIPISYKEAAQIIGISEKHYSKEKSLLKNKNNKKDSNEGGEIENGIGTEQRDDSTFAWVG